MVVEYVLETDVPSSSINVPLPCACCKKMLQSHLQGNCVNCKEVICNPRNIIVRGVGDVRRDGNISCTSAIAYYFEGTITCDSVTADILCDGNEGSPVLWCHRPERCSGNFHTHSNNVNGLTGLHQGS